MPSYSAIRHFLARHHGYYCVDCLAARLKVSPNQVQRSVAQRTHADITMAYRICQSCLEENAVFALRASA